MCRGKLNFLSVVIPRQGRYQAVVGEDIWLDPTEEETRLASGMLLCACMPALGSTTSVWQTGRVLPAKAFQVSDNQFPAVGSSTESKIYVRVFNYVRSVVSTFIKL
jgi:hypothetical protein